MSALAFALDKSSTEAAHKYGLDVALGKMESVWVEYILNAIKRSANYTLLRDAITRFVESRSEPKQRILQAITELESLADEQVLTVPEFHLEEYEEALKRFEALPPLIQPTVEEIQVGYIPPALQDPTKLFVAVYSIAKEERKAQKECEAVIGEPIREWAYT